MESTDRGAAAGTGRPLKCRAAVEVEAAQAGADAVPLFNLSAFTATENSPETPQ